MSQATYDVTVVVLWPTGIKVLESQKGEDDEGETSSQPQDKSKKGQLCRGDDARNEGNDSPSSHKWPSK
jgi:hypothetical protein